MDVFVLREHLVQRSRIAGRKAVFALRIDVQLERDPVRGQRLRIQEAVHDRHAAVGSRVPEERGRRMILSLIHI